MQQKPERVQEYYTCIYCKKRYNHPQEMYQCVNSHDLIFLPISRTDLQCLIRFLYSKDESVLPQSLINLLLSYQTYNRSEK